MKTVLVVDDDPVILTTIVKSLFGPGEDLELLNAGNGQEAVDILER